MFIILNLGELLADPLRDATWKRHMEIKNKRNNNKTTIIEFTTQFSLPNQTNYSSEKQDYRELEENLNVEYTENFRIIWGSSISSFVSDLWGIEQGNNLPEYIIDLKTDLEKSWKTLITDNNFNPPRNSNNYYIDVYIANTGVMDPDSEISGFLQLSPHYSGFAYYHQDGTPYIVLRDGLASDEINVAAAHEFFHTIQYSYKLFESINEITDLWWYEATAVWSETIVYPKNDNYIGHIKSWMNNKGRSLLQTSSYDTEERKFDFSYGSVVWAIYLSETFEDGENFQNVDVIRHIWDSFGNSEKSILSVFDSFFELKNISPDLNSMAEVFADFSRKNLFPEKNYLDNWSKYFGNLKPVYTVDDLPFYTEESLDISAELWGVNIAKIERPYNLDQDLVIHFDGIDDIDSNQPNWVLSIVIESSDGSVSYKDATFSDDYQYQKLILPVSENWNYAYLLLIPVTEVDIPLISISKVPYRLNIGYDEFPTMDIGYGKLVEDQISLTSVSDNGGVQVVLNSGWNLIGWPFPEANLQFSRRIGSLFPFLKSAWSWKQGQWYVFLPSNISENQRETNYSNFSILSNLHPAMGFWLNLNREVILNIEPISNDN